MRVSRDTAQIGSRRTRNDAGNDAGNDARNDARLRQFLDMDAFGIVFFDPRGTLIDANGAFYRMTGYTRDQVERGELTWRRMTPPEWMAITERQMEQLARTGRIGPYEKEYFLRDGSRRWMLFAGRRLEDGTLAEFCIDIDDRKRAEAALKESDARSRNLIESFAQATWEMDPTGSVTTDHRAGPAYKAQAVDLEVGEGWVNSVHPDDRAYAERQWRTAVDAQQNVNAEYRLRREGEESSEGYGWANVVATPLKASDGTTRKWVGMNIDIDARKRAEEILRESLKESEALLTELHHRVKNNLQVITSVLEMQARRVQDPGASALLQEACNRVSSIATIHELLYRSGTFGQVNLVAYARALVPTMVAFCGADQRIQVRVEGEDIMFDLERAVPCGLMLTELVSNVCKHAFPKGARGELLVSVAAADDCVSITAEDNGVGLPEWFDPVKTASLGLKIVKTLTDQLGGRVSFDRGAGNRVQIHLPRTPRAV